MKIKSTLIILLLLFQNSFSQNIRDSIFNDVILIKNENPNINDETFFKNIYIKSQNKPIIIFNGLRNIPAQKFFDRKSFLSDQNEIILINNDDELDALIRRREKTENIHIKAKGQKIYHIIRNGSEIIVDSLSKNIYDFRKPTKINFKKTEIKDRIVYGIVKDSIGEIIAGSNIIVEGTTRGTSSGFDGSYSIKAKPNEYLIFSFVKKKNQRIIANKTEINIELKNDGIPDRIYLANESTQSGERDINLNKWYNYKINCSAKYNFNFNSKNNNYVIYVPNKEKSEYLNILFQEKFNVKYSLSQNLNDKYYKKHNKLTFKYLNKKYNKTWQNEIRKDAIGLDKFIK